MDRQNKVVAVVGRKGSGKSKIFQRILQRCPRVLVFDTMGEHDWIPNRFSSLESVSRFLAWASLRDKYAGSLVPQDEIEPAFDQLAGLVYDQGGMTLGVEEVPFLCSPAYVPPGLDRIVRLGRHREIDLIYTGQRMAEIARRLTAATDVFILFQHTEPRDLEAIAGRCGGEIAERVSELSTHGWLGLSAQILPDCNPNQLGSFQPTGLRDSAHLFHVPVMQPDGCLLQHIVLLKSIHIWSGKS